MRFGIQSVLEKQSHVRNESWVEKWRHNVCWKEENTRMYRRPQGLFTLLKMMCISTVHSHLRGETCTICRMWINLCGTQIQMRQLSHAVRNKWPFTLLLIIAREKVSTFAMCFYHFSYLSLTKEYRVSQVIGMGFFFPFLAIISKVSFKINAFK